MLTSLCTLTPDQWAYIHRHTAKGTVSNPPEGYQRAGLYEARFEGQDTIILIQRANGDGYRFWLYPDIFSLSITLAGLQDEFEIADNARKRAADLRRHAEQLLDEADRLELEANNTLNDVFMGAVRCPVDKGKNHDEHTGTRPLTVNRAE